MAFTDYDELDLVGMHIQSIGWHGEKLRADFGSGYGASAVVGIASGLHNFRIDAKFLPDDETLYEIDGKTWFDYYYDFFIEHTTGDQEYFLIEWRDKLWSVRFKDTQIDFDKFVRTVYYSQGGLELVQVRASDLDYSADGSVDTTAPCTPGDFTAEGISDSIIRLRWLEAEDSCPEDEETVALNDLLLLL